MSLTYATAFSGIEGFGLGFDRAGITPLWQCEIDDAASRVLAHHYPTIHNYRDITTIPADVPRPDVYAAGVPCQDVSIAGRRKGLAGERTRLFFDWARHVDAVRPRWIVFENVDALLSSNDGRDMGTVLDTLADIGFQDIGWRVVNALGFGIPQRRRRLFIVGRLGTGTRTREVLLDPEGSPWRAPQSSEARPGIAATLTAGVGSGRPPGRRGEDDYNLVALALTANGVGTCGVDDNQAQANHLAARMQAFGQYADDGTASTVKARDGKDATDLVVASTITASAGHHGRSSPRGDGSDNLIPVGFNARQDPISHAGYAGPLDTDGHTQAVAFHENQRGELTVTDHAQALTAGGGKPGSGYAAALVSDGCEWRVRRLVPVETERLQGFPDDWTLPAGADTHRYRCVGNAVPVPISQWIGERIIANEAAYAT